MRRHFIYNAVINDADCVDVYTVVFIYSDLIDFTELQNELKIYFQESLIPHHLVVLTHKNNKKQIIKLLTDREILEDAIPTQYLKDNLLDFVSLQVFDQRGKIEILNNTFKVNDETLKIIFNQGMVQIFKERGGLISADISHHFVFPSGKHCNQFLRTGNVLIRSEEIMFIAFNLLKFYVKNYEIIYCDTSSINSLAFALVELKRKLTKGFCLPHIESFGSYKKFEQGEFIDRHKALFLISSSTSANIIDRLLGKNIELKQIALVYCLGINRYTEVIACNLQKQTNNPRGIEIFESYVIQNNKPCNFCLKGSTAVEVKGDVFLLDKPQINKITVTVFDAPESLSKFLETYQSKNRLDCNIIKCNFFESKNFSQTTELAYEIFFDIAKIFSYLNEPQTEIFAAFKKKMDSYIDQYIPSNVQYLIHLPDEASKLFAEYILAFLKIRIKPEYLPEIVHQDHIKDAIKTEKKGSCIIVSSSMVEGGNLVYVSKQMRKFEDLSLIYFIGFARTNNEEYLNFIKKNLCQGKYGINTNSFIPIETFYCSNVSRDTPWVVEDDFLKNIVYFLEEQDESKFEIAINYFNKRQKLISNSRNSSEKGMANSIFYENIFTGKQMIIDKNFAFLKYRGYHTHASQADIFFVISSILNRLRNSKNLDHCLLQTEYVRNILDAENFIRFNDGIIQSAILRSANKKELAYDLDDNLSEKMISILTPIIIHHKNQYGESLMEFLYAISIRKLRLKRNSLYSLLEIIRTNIKGNNVVDAICLYIEKLIINNDKDLNEKYMVKYDN